MPKHGPERVAALGALAIAGSLLLPWYGFKLGSRLSATGLDSFNLAHFALLITAGAALALVVRGRDLDLPRPISLGALVVAAGIWCVLILAFLVADPPNLIVDTRTIGGVRIRYGVLVAAGGAAALVVGGLGIKRAGAHHSLSG